MATARLVVNTALRAIGVLGAGREPRTADATDALNALRNLYVTWVNGGVFGRLSDIIPSGTEYKAIGQERIFRLGAQPLSVELPLIVSDEWTEDYGWKSRYYGTVVTYDDSPNEINITFSPAQPIGQVTAPRDGCPIVISDEVGGNTRHWLYNGVTKRWESPEDMLTLDSDAPRSVDHVGLAACLALELADSFGREVGTLTARQASRFQIAMTHRYGMRREQTVGAFV